MFLVIFDGSKVGWSRITADFIYGFVRQTQIKLQYIWWSEHRETEVYVLYVWNESMCISLGLSVYMNCLYGVWFS